MGDDFREEIHNEPDPEVDNAIAKYRVEAPDAYDATAALSRPSRSSIPQLTESILRDMGRHGARGEGFRGNTPINPEQLRSEAQTRAFFRRAGQNKTQGQAQLDPYAYADAAAQLKEFYNPTQGALKGQHFDPPTEFVDTTLAASNPAEVNPQIAYSQKLANQKAYASAMVIKRRKEAEKNSPSNELNYSLYIDPRENRAIGGEGAKKSPPANVVGVTVDSEGKPIRTGKRSLDQPKIDTSNRDTWTADRDVLGSKKGLTRDQRLKELSEYWSDKEQRWITTNSFDQPKHTAILAKLAFKNKGLDERNNYLSDLKNSIKAELISRHNVAGTGLNWDPKVSHRGNGSSRNPFDKDAKNSIASQKNLDSMANDLMEIEQWKDIVKNNKSEDLGKTPAEINQHIINLKNRYNETKRHAVAIEQPSNRIG